MGMNNIVPELLLPDEAARLLYISTRKLLALARANKINHVRIEGEFYFTAEDIAEFIRARHVHVEPEGRNAN